MKRATAPLSLILCLLLSALPGRSLSQMREPQSREEFQRYMEEQQHQLKQKQEEYQHRMEEQQLRYEDRRKAMQKAKDEYSGEAHQEALGAMAEQWKAIEPMLERIRKLEDSPSIEISVYSVGGAGGFEMGGFTQTPDGGRSTAHASGQASATRGVSTTSDSSMRSGTAGGYGRSFAAGGMDLHVQTPGPVRKQVGDMNLGWQWQRPSLDKSPDKLSEGEKACERLLDVLETDKPNPEQVRQQVAALRKVREQRRTELGEVRKQLRRIVTPEQEAKLILMGILD